MASGRFKFSTTTGGCLHLHVVELKYPLWRLANVKPVLHTGRLDNGATQILPIKSLVQIVLLRVKSGKAETVRCCRHKTIAAC